MTDEPRPQEAGPDNPPAESGQTATLSPTAEGDKPAGGVKLSQTVDIRDIGPCKKHIKVVVDRKDIDERLNEKFSELRMDTQATVAGFRPGKAPRKVIERRYFREVNEQVKSEVLMVSLEQLAEDYDVAPLSAPSIDPNKLELPREGPFIYEFDVEVRPQFDLPNYKGLKLRRPVHTFTSEEVAEEERRLLSPYGQVVPKPEGNAQVGDLIVADVEVSSGTRPIGIMKEQTFTIDRQLAFKDGIAPRFGEQVRGVKAGDQRTVDVVLSQNVADKALAGQTVQGVFKIKDVKSVRLPELTADFLSQFGVQSIGQLRELIEVILQRRLLYQQRQSARQQVLEQFVTSSTWELPEDLLLRQARKAMSRRVMEMKADGISDEEIAKRQRLLQQDMLQTTSLALKEHFVLQKIAEVEKIDVTEDDLNEEVERLAAQNNVSPRRFRAQLEREELVESLMIEMIERKALDLILDSAEYEDVPLRQDEQAPEVSTVEAQAVPGEMQDPTANPPPADAPATPGTPGEEAK